MDSLPWGYSQLTEAAGDLRGVTPRSATLTIDPENWYFANG